MQQSPCVLVYNPISGHGHLDSWNAIFIGLLLERGFRVLAVTPDRTALESRLAKNGLAGHPRLQVMRWKLYRLRLRRMWQWLLSYGFLYTDKRPESRISSGMPLGTRVKKRIFQFIVPPLFIVSCVLHFFFCRMTNGKWFGDRVLDPYDAHYLDPIDMAVRIREILKKSPWKPDCVFNMYLDMYKIDDIRWHKVERIVSLPWGGIRFVPSDPPRKDGYFTLKSFRGLCFLDEAICENYRAMMPERYFQHFPDITNVDLPEQPPKIVDEIKRRAAGRKIVFLGGSIGGHKNIARWCELIQLADPAKWFFAQVGEIHSSTFSGEDAEAFERLGRSLPENVLVYERYLPDEHDFNAVIQAADVIFAAYRNFPISSNMLSKAAHFERPILVSVGHLMERLVRKYQIGIAVSEHDSKAMLEALERLVSHAIPDVNYERYRRDSQPQVLAENLCAFLQHISEPFRRGRDHGGISNFQQGKACSS